MSHFGLKQESLSNAAAKQAKTNLECKAIDLDRLKETLDFNEVVGKVCVSLIILQEGVERVECAC